MRTSFFQPRRLVRQLLLASCLSVGFASLAVHAAGTAAPKAAGPSRVNASHANKSGINWQPWSDALFARAKAENKFILLDMEAVWCHWCHVMDEKTYADPRVAKLINERYIAVKVDSDAHPELARRYEDYGWPATVVFNAQGGEIVKRRGYIPAEGMSGMLAEIIRDPSPINYGDSLAVKAFAASPLLTQKLREEMDAAHIDIHDFKLGGRLQDHKFLDRDTLEYALHRAGQGDAKNTTIARLDLDATQRLIDPVWGGIYQYSTDSDWEHPHFEKIIQFQADALRTYAMGYAQFNQASYKQAMENIHRYVKGFLTSPEGAFYVSQDADLVKGEHSEGYFALDDVARRKLGIPTIDKNIYARENGWMIQALAAAYESTGEKRYLDEAITAANWIIANRALQNGGFRHGERDNGGPYLEDTLSMGRAFLAIYQASAKREWLNRAQQAAAFIEQRFRASGKTPGYVTSVVAKGAVLKPQTITDENIAMARFSNLLFHHSGNKRYRQMSERAMRYLATEQVALRRRAEPGILLAAQELANDPAHIVVVGAKTDASAAALHRAALAFPGVYRRIEWWDRSEGAMPNPDVQYPPLDKPAAFVCKDGACSLPIFDAAELVNSAQRLTAAR